VKLSCKAANDEVANRPLIHYKYLGGNGGYFPITCVVMKTAIVYVCVMGECPKGSESSCPFV